MTESSTTHTPRAASNERMHMTAMPANGKLPLFTKATKKKAKLRMAIIGPSGSGKTYTALRVASAMPSVQRIAVIDTEHGSASKYADQFVFDSLVLDNFAPVNYIAAIEAAGEAGYDALIIDSLSHAWMGKGGVLEMVEAVATRSNSKNSYTAWKDVTPEHQRLIEAMLACKCHLFATMRSKTEYVMDTDSRGKTVPRKVGMAAVQREGMEYEFDVEGNMNLDHEMVISKTRCSAIVDMIYKLPGEMIAKTLGEWLSDGAIDEIAMLKEQAAINAFTAQLAAMKSHPIVLKMNWENSIEMFLREVHSASELLAKIDQLNSYIANHPATEAAPASTPAQANKEPIADAVTSRQEYIESIKAFESVDEMSAWFNALPPGVVDAEIITAFTARKNELYPKASSGNGSGLKGKRVA